MKKTIIIFSSMVAILVLMASCAESKLKEVSPPTTIESLDASIFSSMPNAGISIDSSELVFIDTESDAGFGLRYCYSNETLSGKIGIADKDGHILSNPNYLSIDPIAKNRFIARKFIDNSANSALIDENGKEIIPFFRGEINIINFTDNHGEEAILSVEPYKEGKTFVNLDGIKIIEKTFSTANFTEIGLFYGKTNGEYFFFDNSGKFVCSVKENEIAELKDLKNGYILLVQNHGRYYRYGLKKAGGEQFIPCEYNEIDVVSDNIFVARIGDPQGLDLHDITRIYDGEGNQLSKDGEFHIAYYEKDAEYGVATKLAIGGIDDYIKTYWIIDSKGQRVSENYDKIENKDGAFYGTKDGKAEKIILK